MGQQKLQPDSEKSGHFSSGGILTWNLSANTRDMKIILRKIVSFTLRPMSLIYCKNPVTIIYTFSFFICFKSVVHKYLGKVVIMARKPVGNCRACIVRLLPLPRKKKEVVNYLISSYWQIRLCYLREIDAYVTSNAFCSSLPTGVFVCMNSELSKKAKNTQWDLHVLNSCSSFKVFCFLWQICILRKVSPVIRTIG